MRLPRGVNALLAVLLLLLGVALAVLAAMQYRWIDRVSDAEREQLRANIDFAAHRFADDLRSELGELFDAFAMPGGGDIGERFDIWSGDALNPELVAAIYVVERDGDRWLLRMLDRDTQQLAETTWPASLDSIRQSLEDSTAGGRIHWPPPFIAELPALFIVPRRGPPMLQFLDERPPMPDELGILVQLDRAVLANAFLPRLGKQHFSADTGKYAIAIVQGKDVLYRSDGSWPNASWPNGSAPADFDLRFIPVQPGARRAASMRPRGLDPPPRLEGVIEPWHLIVRRQDGGLDALVAVARRRNLAVSFGILVILAATALVLVALVRRADRVRLQQTQFVASISHELNTPIAALRSAGENLKDGIVADREKLARYGATIVKESARLAEMVAQVLEFAGLQARTVQPPREPVDVASIVDDAVAQCRWLVDGTAVDVETHIDADLPPVRGDARSLTHALQNLIANAIRHGGNGRWVGLRASRIGNRVAITVEDRGPGIDSHDLSHLFEPFYRGRNSHRVTGTGLGLAIVKQIAIVHGGTIEVGSARHGGAAFTLLLPAALDAMSVHMDKAHA